MAVTLDEKEIFKNLFYDCRKALLEKFPNKEGQENEILGHIVNNFLEDLKYNINKMDFKEFYHTYLQNTKFFDCNDFTNSEIEEIIKESSLSERDKTLAKLYWVDNKVEQDIADELYCDIKTIRRNIPKISDILKSTCSKMYK